MITNIIGFVISYFLIANITAVYYEKFHLMDSKCYDDHIWIGVLWPLFTLYRIAKFFQNSTYFLVKYCFNKIEKVVSNIKNSPKKIRVSKEELNSNLSEEDREIEDFLNYKSL